MAKTQGQGNPDWSREETLLALDLYFTNEGVPPGPSDPRVQELSAFLRSLPYHAHASRKTSFRNPDGVAFKVQNLRSVATGKGLPNSSLTDRSVWEEFGSDPARVRALAQAILDSADGIAPLTFDDTDEPEFAEGRLLTLLHRRRERSKKLRAAVVKARHDAGLFKCDLCSCGPRAANPLYAEAEFEVHHMLPVASSGEGKTKVSDMALLCASCHRLLHRLMAVEKRLVPLSEARSILQLPEA